MKVLSRLLLGLFCSIYHSSGQQYNSNHLKFLQNEANGHIAAALALQDRIKGFGINTASLGLGQGLKHQELGFKSGIGSVGHRSGGIGVSGVNRFGGIRAHGSRLEGLNGGVVGSGLNGLGLQDQGFHAGINGFQGLNGGGFGGELASSELNRGLGRLPAGLKADYFSTSGLGTIGGGLGIGLGGSGVRETSLFGFRGDRLGGVGLGGAGLGGSGLGGVGLGGTRLGSFGLGNADLGGVGLGGVGLRGVGIGGSGLTDSGFSGFRLGEVGLGNTRLTGAIHNTAGLEEVKLKAGANLGGAGADGGGHRGPFLGSFGLFETKLGGTKFGASGLNKADFLGAELGSESLDEAGFNIAELKGTSLGASGFSNSHFGGSKLIGAGFGVNSLGETSPGIRGLRGADVLAGSFKRNKFPKAELASFGGIGIGGEGHGEASELEDEKYASSDFHADGLEEQHGIGAGEIGSFTAANFGTAHTDLAGINDHKLKNELKNQGDQIEIDHTGISGVIDDFSFGGDFHKDQKLTQGFLSFQEQPEKAHTGDFNINHEQQVLITSYEPPIYERKTFPISGHQSFNLGLS